MINAARTVLVIEDNELNREILCEILSPQYRVLQAENGQIGLEMLQTYGTRISLILLDIQMPVMNGYEFLDAVREMPHYGNIPIIVTTSSAGATEEIRCLESGASDFVSKPYNTDVVLRRVSSMIRLSEASAVINKIEFDDLTGLYNKGFFYIAVERLLQSDPGTEYDLVCSNIRAFKMISERHGIKQRNQLLKHIANSIRADFPDNICGRISTDVFAVLLPHRPDIVPFLTETLPQVMHTAPIPNVVIQLGICQKVDHQLSASTLCGNALLAIDAIKGQYGKHISEFNEALKQKLVREQLIVDSMEAALEEHQFQVYYQGKYHTRQERFCGAEALVRWIHPEFGFMSPGEFIPLFERNGFISKLDHYVLEQVCRDLRGWIDEGVNVVPISLNVSRADFYDPELVDRIEKVTDLYRIPRELIHLEVTESAYNDDPGHIFSAVEQLRDLGFRIELDDFGSGYSSLHILMDLELDVLKLDRSLVREMTSEKQMLVLNHILSMAHGLGMTVVAEGVETMDQMRTLQSLDCNVIQGYLYARPVPKDIFEISLKQ